jgi:glycosyltransferase involved in cell wall biosynthesis
MKLEVYPALPRWAQSALVLNGWRNDEELADRCAQVRRKVDANPTSERPELSYVLPAFDEEKLLVATLATIAGQAAPGIERIVVDNNSADRTRAIALACGFGVVEEPRQGIARARQAGLESAHGAIYVSADADALYPPTHARTIIDAYAENPRLSATGGEFVYVFVEPRVTRYRRTVDWLMHHAGMRSGEERFPVLRVAVGSTSAYRRSFMLAAGGYRTDFARDEDLEMFARLREYGEVAYLGAQARVYASARREEARGVVDLALGHLLHTIRRRLRRGRRLEGRSPFADPERDRASKDAVYPPIR